MSANWASYSQLVTHRSCPQKWYYGYSRRLEKVDPGDTKVEMHFGSFWHMLRAADSIERGKAMESLCEVPKRLTCVDNGPVLPIKDASVDAVFALAKVWWDAQTPLTQETWVERIGSGLVERLDWVLTTWREQWAEELKTEAPLAVELGWRRELPNLPGPDGTTTNPDVVLIGYVDEIYLDLRRHMVVVRDHKAHKVLSTQTTADDMMDSQLQFYAWGASPAVTAWGKGPIQATAYDRVRMVKPKSPQVTQSGTLSKSVSDFDLKTYLAWCESNPMFTGRRKDGSDGGIYKAEPAMVEKLSSPSAASVWFQRTLTPLNSNLIRAHLRSAVDSAFDMAASRARSAVSDEAARNLTANCRWCDFAGLCRAEMVGGPGGEFDLRDFKLRVRV